MTAIHPLLLPLITAILFFFYVKIRKSGGGALGKQQVTPGLLLLVSVLGLYLELVLIRWIGTEVRIFAFVQNLTLIACFLGFGIGCFRSNKPASLFDSLDRIALIAIIVLLPLPFWQNMLAALSNLLSITSDSALWGVAQDQYSFGTKAALSGFAVALVTLLLWLIIAAMVPIGQWVGYCFDHSKHTVRAYTANLLGSLLGTWLLLVLSVLLLPPIWWFAVVFGLALFLMPHTRSNLAAGATLFAAIAVLMFGTKHTGEVLWSPYQKVHVESVSDTEYLLSVNSSAFMTMANTQPAFLKAHPDIAKRLQNSAFDSPFKFITKHPHVLVVGAGAGNDVSGALRNGAAEVDAVEIDPAIYALGKRLHPDHPYDDPRVHLIINDARNYLRLTDKHYDAILFGTLDSHTGPSGYSNMRVDNYVYTREAFEQAKRLLNPDGIMVFRFEVRHPWTWIGERFYRSLTEVFGRPPVTFVADNDIGYLFGGHIYLESKGDRLWQLAKRPDLKSFLDKRKPTFELAAADAPQSATDDWPYPYSRDRMIPRTYGVVSLILLVLSFFLVRRDITFTEPKSWTMFNLGAGFMLMETQLINRLCLYFGTTWIVSSIAISMVLIVLVLANLYVDKRANIDRKPLYGLLVASLLANYFIPWEQMNLSPTLVGALLSAAFAVSVWLAGVIFTSTLREAKQKSATLGANILGAVVGGIAQNLSFIVGLKALLLFAAATYAVAAWSARKH